MRTSASGATLLLRNSTNGETIACMTLPNTKGQWTEVTAHLTAEYTGKYDLIVELAEMPEAGKVELDWFRLDA